MFVKTEFLKTIAVSFQNCPGTAKVHEPLNELFCPFIYYVEVFKKDLQTKMAITTPTLLLPSVKQSLSCIIASHM